MSIPLSNRASCEKKSEKPLYDVFFYLPTPKKIVTILLLIFTQCSTEVLDEQERIIRSYFKEQRAISHD